MLHSGLPAILGSVFIWGTMPFVVQYAAQDMPAAQLITIRLLLAGLLLSMNLGGRRVLRAIRSNIKLFLILGAIGFTLPHLFYIYALRTVPIPVLTFISNSYPALAIILATIFLKEKPSSRHILGMTSALIGLFLLTGPGNHLDKGVMMGVVFALFASLGWASSAVAGKKITTRLSTVEIVAGRHLVGGVFAIPLIFIEGANLKSITGLTGLAILLLAVMSVISFYLYYRGLSKLSVSTASVLESFTPVITLTISAVIFGEALQGLHWVGALLVLLGTVMVSARAISLEGETSAVAASD